MLLLLAILRPAFNQTLIVYNVKKSDRMIKDSSLMRRRRSGTGFFSEALIWKISSRLLVWIISSSLSLCFRPWPPPIPPSCRSRLPALSSFQHLPRTSLQGPWVVGPRSSSVRVFPADSVVAIVPWQHTYLAVRSPVRYDQGQTSDAAVTAYLQECNRLLPVSYTARRCKWRTIKKWLVYLGDGDDSLYECMYIAQGSLPRRRFSSGWHRFLVILLKALLRSCEFDVLTVCLLSFYSNAVVFMSNGYFRRMLQGGDEKKVLSLSEMGVAGGLAGSVMAFFNCPIELLKVKLQVQDPKGVIGASGQLEPPVRYIMSQ